MLINIVEELKRRDLDSSNKYDLYTTYTCNKYTSEEKKKLAESLANGKSNKVIYNIIKREDLEAKTVGKAGDILFEDFKENEVKIGKKLNEDCCCSDSPIHFYGLFNYKIGNCAADDQLNLLNVCTAKSLCAAEDKLSPMCSEYVTEIYEEDYDNYFKGNNNLLDEGAIWDAIKSGAKGVKDAIKSKKTSHSEETQDAIDAKKAAKQVKKDAAQAYRDAKADVKYKKRQERSDRYFGRQQAEFDAKEDELARLRAENDAADEEERAADRAEENGSAETGTTLDKKADVKKVSGPSKKTSSTEAKDKGASTGSSKSSMRGSMVGKSPEDMQKRMEAAMAGMTPQEAAAVVNAARRAQSKLAKNAQRAVNTASENIESFNRGDRMIKLRNFYEAEDQTSANDGKQSFKVVFSDEQVVRAKNPGEAVSEFKKNHENAKNVHVDTSWKPEENIVESLKESRIIEPKYKDGDTVFTGDASGYVGTFLIEGDFRNIPEELHHNIRKIIKYGNLDKPYYTVEYQIDSNHYFEEDYKKFFDFITPILNDVGIRVLKSKEELYSESLTEDLDSDELADFGFNASIMDAINDEYETINKYNALLITLKQENRGDVAKVIEDIIEEEYTHIGQLQAILETYSEASEAIEDGIEEAEEQLGAAEETSVDDDFGSNNGFDIFM